MDEFETLISEHEDLRTEILRLKAALYLAKLTMSRAITDCQGKYEIEPLLKNTLAEISRIERGE